jgi:hypothetical protein
MLVCLCIWNSAVNRIVIKLRAVRRIDTASLPTGKQYFSLLPRAQTGAGILFGVYWGTLFPGVKRPK